jgi:two-component system cell cycle response regulator CtrA
MHILVVEDYLTVADVRGVTIEEAGYFKTTADVIETALFELKHNQIDAVLLALNLPDGDGTRLARLIRKNHMPVPILVVSGNSGIDEKIAALGAGADGCLAKPFDRYELVANLDTIIRRTHGHSPAAVNVGNLMLDFSQNYAKIGDAQLDLTAKEFRIIEFF